MLYYLLCLFFVQDDIVPKTVENFIKVSIASCQAVNLCVQTFMFTFPPLNDAFLRPNFTFGTQVSMCVVIGCH